MAAAAVADQLTVATIAVPELKQMNGEHSDDDANTSTADTKKAEPSEPKEDSLVALVLSRPEIKSVSDLTSRAGRRRRR